jgi:ribosomal protein S12 methylthiotransferase accessory factor
MEAIERYSGIFQGDEIRARRRFTDFAPGDAISPNDVLLYSAAQARGVPAPASGAGEAPAMAPFDRSAEIEWSPVWSLRDQRFKCRPACVRTTGARPLPGARRSNGCAAGNTLEEAIVRASSSWWNATPMRSGGTIDRSGRRWTSVNSTIPISVI